ncbi:MAG: preprotein translocase subunit SecG [Methylococcales bacterium]|nr:preprotein translocase subunit SecG [Methylococcales bacterium]
MYQLIIIIHVLLGLGVVGLILMQQGKGADAGAAFSGGGASSVFGAQGAASFLSRTTAVLAALFFTTSLGLAVLSGYENKSVDLMDKPDVIQPLEDVPLVGDLMPSLESTPVITETPSEAVIAVDADKKSLSSDVVVVPVDAVKPDIKASIPVDAPVEESAPVASPVTP